MQHEGRVLGTALVAWRQCFRDGGGEDSSRSCLCRHLFPHLKQESDLDDLSKIFFDSDVKDLQFCFSSIGDKLPQVNCSLGLLADIIAEANGDFSPHSQDHSETNIQRSISTYCEREGWCEVERAQHILGTENLQWDEDTGQLQGAGFERIRRERR